MEHYLQIVWLSLLPLFYKIGFWLYVFQLKNYRWDRFREYISTPQGKKAIFNFLFYLEFLFFISGIFCFLGYIDEYIFYYLFVFLLQFENFFVFYKIFSLKLILPKFTGRIAVLSFIIILDIIIGFYWGTHEQKILVYLLLPALLIFSSIYIAFWNFISSGIFDLIKNRKYNQANKKLSQYKLHKIGITGSFGKSSIKEYLSSILSVKHNVIKTPENINTEIGIANFILNEDFSNYDFFVAEMGAYRKGEITTCGNIVNQKDAFVTGLGNQHIGLFGGQQNIIDAKFEIGNKVLENKGKLYLNNANIVELNQNFIHIKDELGIIDYKGKTPEIVKKLLKEDRIIFYGKYIKILEQNENGTKFMVSNHIFETNLIGKGQIENLEGTILYALNQGFTNQEIQNGLNHIQQPKNTLEIIQSTYDIDKLKNGQIKKENYTITVIDDTYNLSINGLINAVEILNNFKGKKILILEDILELGKNSFDIHYKVGKYLANKVDEVLYVGINYNKQFKKGFTENNGQIIEKLQNDYLEDVIILFEGKKSKKYLSKISVEIK